MDDTPKAPRAKVRRVLDAEPLVLTPPKLKLRPFTECFDRGAGVPALVMRAEIEGDRLLVSITGREVVVLAGSADRDGHGVFIVLDAQEHPIGAEHALRLDADARDGDDSHAALSYFELTRDRVAREELAYAERWYSVYFNPLGLVDGTGSSGPRSLVPRPLPS
ncbi:MAG TPA: hypothetical protein VMG12_12415 [Polyangiaceae bacterium]|nr:hypothetical protein [Polyangiaceae bacterium]